MAPFCFKPSLGMLSNRISAKIVLQTSLIVLYSASFMHVSFHLDSRYAARLQSEVRRTFAKSILWNLISAHKGARPVITNVDLHTRFDFCRLRENDWVYRSGTLPVLSIVLLTNILVYLKSEFNKKIMLAIVRKCHAPFSGFWKKSKIVVLWPF